MKLSEDRINHISHLIHDRLYLDEIVDFPDEEESLRIIKKIFNNYMQLEDQVDDMVRQKIQTLKRGVQEGSPEWEVLHRKYFEEEMKKKGFA